MNRHRTLACAALLAIAGCNHTTSPENADPAGLDGAWALQAFDLASGSSIAVADPSQYTVDFRDDDRVHVRADCNVCNSGYTVSGGNLSLGLMACTLVACPPGSHEFRYVRALESASSFEITGDTLRLTYAEGVMRFSRR